MNASPPAEIVRTGGIAAAVLLVAVIAFYGGEIATASHLFFTHDIGASDIWHLNYPIRHFYAEGLKDGRLPLWCPEAGTGFPLHADGQVAALYPLNLVLYGLLPLPLAFNWSLLIHVVLAGAFAAMYTRQMGAGRGGSLVAGVVFAFAGFFVTHLKHVSMTASAVWIPLLLLLLERYARGRSSRTLAGVAVVVALMILGGHPQIAYNNLLVAAGYVLYLLVRIWRRGVAEGGGRAGALRFGGGLLYALLLGVLLASPQVLPTLELKSLGLRRAGLSLQEATYWQYKPKHLLAFVAPKAFGDPGELAFEPVLDPRTGEPLADPGGGKPPVKVRGFDRDLDAPILFWEMTGYVGLLPLLLAGVCLSLGRRDINVWMLTVLLLVSLLLTLGKSGGLFYLLWHFPGFNLFRFHGRFLVYADLALAVMAGLGLTQLTARLSHGRRRATAAGLAVVVGALCFADLKFWLGDHNPKIEAERWTTPPESAVRMKEDAEGELFRYAHKDPQQFVFKNAYYRAAGWKGDLGPYDVARTQIQDNLNLLYGLTNLFVFYPNQPFWMHRLSEAFLPFNPRTREHEVNHQVARAFNVRYLIDHGESPRHSYLLLAEYPGDVSLQRVAIQLPGFAGLREPVLLEAEPFRLRLYENPGALPRAFLVPRARLVRDEWSPAGPTNEGLSEAQRALLDPAFDPREEVLIVRQAGDEVGSFAGGAPGRAIGAPVRFIEYAPHRVHLRVEAPRDSWLFFSDTFYPGWTVTVDGEESRIHRANLSGRAVRLPSGAHDVVFVFAPGSFRWGLVLAGVAIVLLATLELQRRGLGAFLSVPPRQGPRPERVRRPGT